MPQPRIKNIVLNPAGNTGAVMMAIEFDKRVEIDGNVFGFPIEAVDAVELHRQLGKLLAHNRIISLPGMPGFGLPRSGR
jgi:hypothetical protein